MMTTGLTELTATGKIYLEFLNEVMLSIQDEYPRIEQLCHLITSAHSVHIFGFGRSGCAALAFAIRLRHFCNYLPPVFWVGDQVRQPIREGDVVILFSGSGDRPEINLVAQKAKKASASVVLITAAQNSVLGAQSDLTLVLPEMKDSMVYGGGDFELGAFFLQEILVTHIGKRFGIPREEVERNHV